MESPSVAGAPSAPPIQADWTQHIEAKKEEVSFTFPIATTDYNEVELYKMLMPPGTTPFHYVRDVVLWTTQSIQALQRCSQKICWWWQLCNLISLSHSMMSCKEKSWKKIVKVSHPRMCKPCATRLGCLKNCMQKFGDKQKFGNK